MEQLVYALVLGIGAIGVAASVIAALRLATVTKLVGERWMLLEALALGLYAVALAVEAAGIASSLIGGPPTWAPMHHRREMIFTESFREAGQVLQASLLAGYVYIMAYVVHAASLYTSMNPERITAPLATLALIYTDYNIIALIVVAVILYMLYAIYRASVQAIAYHSVIAASHVLGTVYAALPSTPVILASFALRGLAPILLHLPPRRSGGLEAQIPQ